MIRRVAAVLLFGSGVLAGAAGCAVQPGAADSRAAAPYSEEDNPFCGALGNCRPLSTAPYPMRGNYGAY